MRAKILISLTVAFILGILTVLGAEKVTKPTNPSVPSQTESKTKKQSSKKQEKPAGNTERKNKDKKSVSSPETINGFTVRWNGATTSQKVVITELLNNMVFVEEGTFVMGSNDALAFSMEKPAHHEVVLSFWIGRYEVTQKQWEAIMGNNPAPYKGENLPIDCINMSDCMKFIKKINSLTGLRFRLPNESEWEYAAKGGNRSHGYKFSGGNLLETVAWYGKNSGDHPHPVGTKAPNELGLYDMTGNVAEYTSSKWCDNYDFSKPIDSNKNVVRDGFYGTIHEGYLRTTYREGKGLGTGRGIGFRLAL